MHAHDLHEVFLFLEGEVAAQESWIPPKLISLGNCAASMATTSSLLFM